MTGADLRFTLRGGHIAALAASPDGGEEGVANFDAILLSGEPVEAWDYQAEKRVTYIFDLNEKSVSFRLQGESIPLFHQHEHWSEPIGRAQGFKFENGNLGGQVSLLEDAELAKKWRKKMATALSVGFKILESRYDENTNSRHIERLEIFEVSSVGLPADAGAGLLQAYPTGAEKGAGLQSNPESLYNRENGTPTENRETRTMSEPTPNTSPEGGAPAAPDTAAFNAAVEKVAKERATAALADYQQQTAKLAKTIDVALANRPESVKGLRPKLEELGRRSIDDGKGVPTDEIADVVLAALANTKDSGIKEVDISPEANERRTFADYDRLAKFEAEMQKTRPDMQINDRLFQAGLQGANADDAGKEQLDSAAICAELSQEFRGDLADDMGAYLNRGGVYIPHVFQAAKELQTFAQTTTGGGISTSLIETDIAMEHYRKALYGNVAMVALGVRMLYGVSGIVRFTRQSTTRSVGYLANETASINPTDIAWSSGTIEPHRVGTATDVSFQALFQTKGNLFQILMTDLYEKLQEKCEDVFIGGTGSGGEPSGIMIANGTNSISHGVNGGAISWAGLMKFITAIRNENIRRPVKALTTPDVVGYGMTTPRAAGNDTPILKEPMGAPLGGDTMTPDGMYMGVPIYCSTLLPEDGTKGAGTNLRTMIFGDWSECIYATFGGGDIVTIDDITGARDGQVKLTIQRWTDNFVLRPASLSIATDISVA